MEAKQVAQTALIPIVSTLIILGYGYANEKLLKGDRSIRVGDRWFALWVSAAILTVDALATARSIELPSRVFVGGVLMLVLLAVVAVTSLMTRVAYLGSFSRIRSGESPRSRERLGRFEFYLFWGCLLVLGVVARYHASVVASVGA